MRPVLLSIALIGLALGAACRREEPSSGPALSERRAEPAEARRESKGESNGSKGRIVFLGDSLTAGLGLSADASFPSVVQRRLNEGGYKYEVVNAGVSGDTSAGGLRRLDWALDGDVKILVVALGANDGLRGLPPPELKKNLSAILERATAKGITVILAGMEAPPNFGAEYTLQFRSVYADLAKAHNVKLLPFLLDGVAGIENLNQGDGIHPNVRGARMVADLVWGSLEPVLQRPAADPR